MFEITFLKTPKQNTKGARTTKRISVKQQHLIAAYVGFEPTSLCRNTNALPIKLIGSTSIAINHIEPVLHKGRQVSLLTETITTAFVQINLRPKFGANQILHKFSTN